MSLRECVRTEPSVCLVLWARLFFKDLRVSPCLRSLGQGDSLGVTRAEFWGPLVSLSLVRRSTMLRSFQTSHGSAELPVVQGDSLSPRVCLNYLSPTLFAGDWGVSKSVTNCPYMSKEKKSKYDGGMRMSLAAESAKLEAVFSSFPN